MRCGRLNDRVKKIGTEKVSRIKLLRLRSYSPLVPFIRDFPSATARMVLMMRV